MKNSKMHQLTGFLSIYLQLSELVPCFISRPRLKCFYWNSLFVDHFLIEMLIQFRNELVFQVFMSRLYCTSMHNLVLYYTVRTAKCPVCHSTGLNRTCLNFPLKVQLHRLRATIVEKSMTNPSFPDWHTELFDPFIDVRVSPFNSFGLQRRKKRLFMSLLAILFRLKVEKRSWREQ